MQALQQENAQLMARIAEMQAERQPTEEYAEVMNKAIADAAEAEAQRDAALVCVVQLEAQLRATPRLAGDGVTLEEPGECKPGMARWALSGHYRFDASIDVPANVDLHDCQLRMRRGICKVRVDDGTRYDCAMARSIYIKHCCDDELEVDYRL
jgi:hypothetical protein